MSKKLLASACAAALAAGLLAGCAGGTASSSGAAASTGASGAAASAASAEASSAEAAPESSEAASAAADAEADGHPGASGGASAADTAQEVVATGEAITADMIADGTYDIDVQSSSSMFRIESCQLVVEGDQMTATLNLSAHGYEKLFMGTGADAENATDEQFYPWTDDDGDNKYSYTVPVEALDVELDCAAFSIRKQTWYDRTLVFESGNIPADAISR